MFEIVKRVIPYNGRIAYTMYEDNINVGECGPKFLALLAERGISHTDSEGISKLLDIYNKSR